MLSDASFSSYVALNGRLHALFREMSGSGTVARELERVTSMSFSSPAAFVLVQANAPQARDLLVVAQDQHRQVLDAIEKREGGRA